MVYLQNISTSLGLFWDHFPNKKSQWDLDLQMHFHSLLDCFTLQSHLLRGYFFFLYYDSDIFNTFLQYKPNYDGIASW